MSRIGKESPLSGERVVPASSSLLLRRGRSLTGGGVGVEEDERLDLDLFSKSRGANPVIGFVCGSDGQDESMKSVGQSKIARSDMDDLLDAELGKHDYDWLLTPPGTPHFPLSDASTNENPSPAAAPKRTSTVRSVSTTRTSRLSASQTENGQSARPARSSSVTRASISSGHVSNHNRTSILNTSSASVISRPSTPGRRPTTPTSAKPSTIASRPVPARLPSPVKTRPNTSSGIRTGPSQNTRPSTPTSQSRISTSSTSSSSSVTRSNSRPLTPTRQPIARSATPGPTVGRSPSVGRIPASNIRAPHSAPSSRPSSPSQRPRAPVRPIDLPDFPNDAPPNLRTKLPDRPLSAGRSRPGTALTVRASPNTEVTGPPSSNRRISFPIVARSKFPENASKVSLQSNGYHATPPENKKIVVSDAGSRKAAKPATATESTGFGRTISKKSLDMALRHMDIRQSLGGIRGASLFPQSIRSSASKARPARMSDPVVTVTSDDLFAENDGCSRTISGDLNEVSYNSNSSSKSPDREGLMTRETFNDLDLCASYRYDAMLLKEDLNSTNWLHSVDDKSDQSSVFDHRFEPLPEPFDPV